MNVVGKETDKGLSDQNTGPQKREKEVSDTELLVENILEASKRMKNCCRVSSRENEEERRWH